MGVSLSGWGRILEEYPTQDTCLEISSVFTALKYFLPQLRDYHVLVCFNTMMVVSHFNYQGGVYLYALYRLARKILFWAETSFLGLRVIFILGCINQEADILLMQGVRQGEWHPHAYGKSLAQAVHCPCWNSCIHTSLRACHPLHWRCMWQLLLWITFLFMGSPCEGMLWTLAFCAVPSSKDLSAHHVSPLGPFTGPGGVAWIHLWANGVSFWEISDPKNGSTLSLCFLRKIGDVQAFSQLLLPDVCSWYGQGYSASQDRISFQSVHDSRSSGHSIGLLPFTPWVSVTGESALALPSSVSEHLCLLLELVVWVLFSLYLF